MIKKSNQMFRRKNILLAAFLLFILSASYENCSRFSGLASENAFTENSVMTSNVGSLNPSTLGTHDFEIHKVHIVRDLVPRGCDPRFPTSISCRTAAHRYCKQFTNPYSPDVSLYAGGFGPVEWATSTANVICFKDGGSNPPVREISFVKGGECVGSDPVSLACAKQAQFQCKILVPLDNKILGALGVFESSGDLLSAFCARDGSRYFGVSTSSLESELVKNGRQVIKDYRDLTIAWHGPPAKSGLEQPNEAPCSESTAGGCQIYVNHYCQMRSPDPMGAGFSITAQNNSSYAFFCARLGNTRTINTLDSEMIWDMQVSSYKGTGVYPEAVVTFGAPIAIHIQDYGTKIFMDGLRNQSGMDLLVTKVEANLVGLNSNIGQELVLFEDQPEIRLSPNQSSGEILGIMNDYGPLASNDFRGVGGGYLWKAGSVVSGQLGTIAVPANPETKFGEIKLTVRPVGSGGFNHRLKRLRFPNIDGIYMVPANSKISIPAGCETPNCAYRQLIGGANAPYQGFYPIVRDTNGCQIPMDTHCTASNTNKIYSIDAPIHIRGITFFGGTGLGVGLQAIDGTVRIMSRQGTSSYVVNTSSPSYNTYFAAIEPFDKNVFYRTLTSLNLNWSPIVDSTFAPLDILVPANSGVGVDLRFTNYGDVTPMGTAIYLWYTED